MIFGQKLKELRLKYAKQGLRNFSRAMEMGGAEYSNMERGLTPPPSDETWLHELCKKLKVPPGSMDELDLYAEWNKPFVMQMMDEDIVVCHGLMTDDSSATPEKLGEVSEYLQNIAKEHNKKARKYNETKS